MRGIYKNIAKGISVAVLATCVSVGYFIHAINNAGLQAMRNLSIANEYLQEENYSEALKNAIQCHQIRFLPDYWKKATDELIKKIELEKEEPQKSLEKKLREDKKDGLNFQELVSLEKRIETELENRVAEAKEEGKNIEKEERNFKIDNIANVNVTFGYIDKELYWEYKSKIPREIPEISISDYLSLINTGKPIKISVDNEAVYLLSPEAIEKFDLPLKEMESEKYILVKATANNKNVDNKKVVSVYLEEYQEEIWKNTYINALIFAEEKGVNIVSIDSVTASSGTKDEFSGEISVRFSTYKTLSEEEWNKRKKDEEMRKDLERQKDSNKIII